MDFGSSLETVHNLGSKYNLNSKRVISSSYWKVPDPKSNLTSVACHDTDPLIAVASASKDSNIFIYEVSAPPSHHFGKQHSDQNLHSNSNSNSHSKSKLINKNSKNSTAASSTTTLLDSSDYSNYANSNLGSHDTGSARFSFESLDKTIKSSPRKSNKRYSLANDTTYSKSADSKNNFGVYGNSTNTNTNSNSNARTHRRAVSESLSSSISSYNNITTPTTTTNNTTSRIGFNSKSQASLDFLSDDNNTLSKPSLNTAETSSTTNNPNIISTPQKKHKHTKSASSISSASTLLSSSSTNSSYARPLNRTPILTHHQTISLGGIHSLAWVPSKHKLSEFGNVLATGHSGVVHLVMLPDPYANNGPAEILSRFNHTRHLPQESITSSRIRSLNISSSTWTCCAQSAILSLFSEHLFLWDPSRGDLPIIKQQTKRARSFNASPLRNGIVSLATDRGISIMDIRYKNPAPLAPPTANDGLVSLVKWSPIDENRVASVHDQTIIKIWDIRAGAPLVTLDGHYDKINSLDWSTTDSNEFFSASSDGTVRLWDLQKCSDLDLSNSDSIKTTTNSSSTINDTPSSTVRDPSGDWLPSKSWRLYRQRLARENSTPSYNYFLDNIQNSESPCTTIFSNDKEFLSLGTVQLPLGYTGDYRFKSANSISVPQMITIDNEGFFGLHSRIPVEEDLMMKDVANISDTDVSTVASTSPISSPTKSSHNISLGSEDRITMDCKDPYSGGPTEIKRTSLDSLASMTSKSANGADSDINLDDSLSDTSGSMSASSPIASNPGSPSGLSSSLANIPDNLAPAIAYSLALDDPNSPLFEPKESSSSSSGLSLNTNDTSSNTHKFDASYSYNVDTPKPQRQKRVSSRGTNNGSSTPSLKTSSSKSRRHSSAYNVSSISTPVSKYSSTSNVVYNSSQDSSNDEQSFDYPARVQPLNVVKSNPSSPSYSKPRYSLQIESNALMMEAQASSERRRHSSHYGNVNNNNNGTININTKPRRKSRHQDQSYRYEDAPPSSIQC